MLSLSFLFNFVACVPDTTLLKDLTSDDLKALCLEQGEYREYTCDEDGVSITYSFGYEDTTDCDDLEVGDYPDDCEATVGDSRACNDALEAAVKEDACLTEFPSECDAIIDCAM